jgi:hypothetical protein
VEPCEFGNLYLDLLPKAQQVVASSFRGICFEEIKIIAHDMVTDFLYFSKSFSEYFDPTKGSIGAYFSAYVRKKCRGERTRHFTPCLGLESVPVKDLAKDDTFSWWFEFGDDVKKLKEKLSGFESSGVDLGELLVANLVLSIWEDSSRLDGLSQMFNVSRVQIRKALKVMQGKVRLYDGTSYICRVISRRPQGESKGSESTI